MGFPRERSRDGASRNIGFSHPHERQESHISRLPPGYAQAFIEARLDQFATVTLEARQADTTTLAKQGAARHRDAVHLDHELPSDLALPSFLETVAPRLK